MRRATKAIILLTAVLAALPAFAEGQPDLVGLWWAARDFGPAVKGPLTLFDSGGKLMAKIGSDTVPVTVHGATLRFALPGDKGSFRGKRGRSEITGFWIQPPTTTLGSSYATPVTLRKSAGAWRGEVKALEDRFNLFLPVTRTGEGALATYLRNPERNIGVFNPVKALEVENERVSLVGTNRRTKARETFYTGRIDGDALAIEVPERGGEYRFTRTDGEGPNPFYPRGAKPERYQYTRPPQRADGWGTATLEEVGISQPAIENFLQRLIDTPMAGADASQVHSVLVARHGLLVLEEYFHGYDRDQPHDTRSAAKSLTAMLVGAAMQAGVRVGPATPVYQTMLGRLPKDLDPAKRAMTLENLLTMTSGHFCDDNNDDAPGNEEVMQEQQKERDWYRYILALPMDRKPGEKIVYCSADAHLAGGVLAKAAGEPWVELFDRLIARPLQMGPYAINLAPTGVAYTGGGAYMLPRDFLKVAQVMMDDGKWRDRQIVSRDWARQATAPLRYLTPLQQYGYLWNSVVYLWQGKRVRAFFAAGNGGQIFMAIPDLALAIAFTGGNYNDRTALIPQRVMVPEDILPAVQ